MNSKTNIFLLIIFVFQTVAYAGWFDSKATKEKLKKKDEPDHLTLAALMIRDGHYERAKFILLEVDQSVEGFNFVKYHTLKGLIGLQLGEYQDAQVAFLESIKAAGDNVDPIVYVYIAQAYYADANFERTLWSLERAGDYINTMPDLLGVKATCYWTLKKQPEAFAVLENADTLYPKRSDFKIREIFYLIELQLFIEAAEQSKEFLSRFGAQSKSYLIVGEAMRRSKNYDDALLILEQGHLKYPADEKILLSLAHTYMQAKKTIASARLFEKAAAYDPKYLEQSIGLYRMVGDTWKAKFLNAQVTDSKVKLSQWMEIMLEEQNYEEILAVEQRLSRFGILKTDKLRYAMAYVHFLSENYNASESYLKGISDPQIFKNSVKLLEAIEVYRARSIKL